MDVRRMRNLSERLPPNSQVAFELNNTPPEGRLWDVNTYMLANIYDILAALDWHFIAANSKHTPKPPKPLKRPGSEPAKKTKKNVWPGKTIIDRG